MRRPVAEDEPRLRCGAAREWSALSARRIEADAGRHAARPQPNHRLVFYETDEVAVDCACEGLRRTHLLAAGLFDLIPAGAEGAWRDAAPVGFVMIRFAPHLVASTAEALGARGAVDLAPQLGARDPVVEEIASALAAELDAPRPAARIYTDGLAAALASRLLQTSRAAGSPRRRSLSRPQLRRVLDLIEGNLAEDLPLERIADAARVSVPHFTAMFRRTTGQSVHRYVMERRVQRARCLLQDRRIAIADVAGACGFTHQSHLARWTRRVLGATPTQLRGP